MSLLTVILLCRNRPKYATQAIQSILNQTEKSFKFVISDNSTNRDMLGIVKADFPSLEYLSWFPGISQVEHFKELISLVTTPYFVLFHDDDLMEPEYVKYILEQFQSTPLAAAVATNGVTINSKGQRIIKNEVGFKSHKIIETFYDKNRFVLQYLVGDFGGIASFCSYAYNTNLIRGIYPNFLKCRYYFDTIFLSEILERGPIVWINKSLVRVRTHEANLSFYTGVLDYKSFISFLSIENGYRIKQRYVDEYHLTRLYVALERKGKGMPIPVLKFYIMVFPKLMIYSHTFRKRVQRKIIKIVV